MSRNTGWVGWGLWLCLSIGCGETGGIETSMQPVVGGVPIPEDVHPWAGAVTRRALGRHIPYCSGTLIAPDIVVTAGHCVDPELLGRRRMHFVTRADAWGRLPSHVVRSALRWETHPDFDLRAAPRGEAGPVHDIGLIQLSAPFEREAALLDDSPPTVGEELDLVGYGMAQPGFARKRMGTAIVAEQFPWEVLVDEDSPANACLADSGGGLFAGQVLTAIVSRGSDVPDCDGGGFYTRVDIHREWIAETIAEWRALETQ